jgi:hypothetical protein
LNHISKEIEYNGQIYFGWRELKDSTRISKYLYKTFYLKGLDPTPRIGKDGPVPKEMIIKLVNKKENQRECINID